MKRATGRVRLWRNRLFLCERNNLVVNAGLPEFAKQAAGNNGAFVAVVGFGSGSTAPTVGDIDLAGPQKYYNAVGSASYPSSGTVQFAFSLSGTDYAGSGITVQELGLFANGPSVQIPAASGFTYSSWAADTIEAIGNLVKGGSGHVFRCTIAGTTGSSAPSWNTSAIGDTTADGSVTWTYIAAGTVPSPMIAHAVVPSFAFSISGGAYSGTWSLTF